MRGGVPTLALVFVTALLAACTQNPNRQAAADELEPPAASDHIGPGTFAQLNALQREANALNSPLAVHEFYRRRYEPSEGGLRNLIAQVLAANESELGDYEGAVHRFRW